MTSSRVNGRCTNARGLRAAHWRDATATSAICSRVVPNSYMWRAAANVYCEAGLMRPKGASYEYSSATPLRRKPARVRAAREVLPYAMSAVSHSPAATATAAW